MRTLLIDNTYQDDKDDDELYVVSDGANDADDDLREQRSPTCRQVFTSFKNPEDWRRPNIFISYIKVGLMFRLKIDG